MLKLLAVIYIIFLSLCNLLNIILDFINKREHEKIPDRTRTRILVSALSGILIGLLYAKYTTSFILFKYIILMTYLIICGYIDAHTKNVYTFISIIFLVIGLVFLGIDLVYYNADIYSYLVGILVSLVICSGLGFIKWLGWGDVEVFVISTIYIGGFISVFNIFLALAIAGIGSIYRLIFKKAKLNDRGALCPYIAIASYLLIIFIL